MAPVVSGHHQRSNHHMSFLEPHIILVALEHDLDG